MTLERRRKKEEPDVPTPDDKSDKVKTTSEKARRDASDRAAELLARLRKL